MAPPSSRTAMTRPAKTRANPPGKAKPRAAKGLITSGVAPFSIAGRIVRELGERLVKQPEVALLELVKNAYDADATHCTVRYEPGHSITVADDGHGMTYNEFIDGWMRIGTASKHARAGSRTFNRQVSGEKGIGRFAVSYLGRHLALRSVADDPTHGRTVLEATFDWPQFDREFDLGVVQVPYTLRHAGPDDTPGTTLVATALRPVTDNINFRQVHTGSLGLLSGYGALLRRSAADPAQQLPDAPKPSRHGRDPGFDLTIEGAGDEDAPALAAAVLNNFVLRAVVSVKRSRMQLRVYRRGVRKPVLKIDDRFAGAQGQVYADLRFFPARAGTFAAMPADGRAVRTWIKENAGVAVFDRDFRVLPYGTPGDDWLKLGADSAVNQRIPRSSTATKHFPMDANVQSSTQLNYMLRLPEPQQLVGAVQVYGTRTDEQNDRKQGLVATTDRQGFVNNRAFWDLFDVVRGAAEAIAYCDREWQQELDRQEMERLAQQAKAQTQEAIEQVKANTSLSTSEKKSLVTKLTVAQEAMQRSDDLDKARESALEVMSLLGVVAGFMTHEFGTAIHELQQAQQTLEKFAKRDPAIAAAAASLTERIKTLSDFVTYSQGYIKGTTITPVAPTPVLPRIRHALRYFQKYASERGIKVHLDVEAGVLMPEVPISLYSGIVLNLYTNALKAVIGRSNHADSAILIRAEERDGRHRLLVADTGVGIPSALSERIFDPLFTTTESERDPLRSGMGLGLTLVRRTARVFGGGVKLVRPPEGYVTCFEVSFPLEKHQ